MSRHLLRAAASLFLVPLSLQGQASTFNGRVLTDSGAPLPGAEIVLAALQRTIRADAKGEFRFTAVPAGTHIVGIRMPGYQPRGDTIEVADAGNVHREYRLARGEATLPEVPVTTTSLDRRLRDFHERRKLGIGRFLDSAEFADTRGTRTSDRLAKLPGLQIVRGRASEAFVRSTRQPGFCPATVWINGVRVGADFNVNEFDPIIIAAIEWYAGQSSIPAQFNVPGRPGQIVCGVLVIWTR